MVKLFRGSSSSIADNHTHIGLKSYEFVMRLKEHYPYSYISDFKARRREVAKTLAIDPRTLDSRIEKALQLDMAYYEGSTLRFLSYTEIKSRYAKRKRSKHSYTVIEISNLSVEIRLQPIAENIRKQQSAIMMKSKNGSDKKAGRQSSFREIIKSVPTFRSDVVDSTLLSQQKAASLLGYRSSSSGYKQLKRLSMAKRLVIESNRVELTRDEYNQYKKTRANRLLIQGKGNQARFFYLEPNSVSVVKHKSTSTSVKGESFYNSSYW